MSASWTLADEIRKIAGKDKLDAALREIGLLGSSDNLSDLITVRDWYRSGAETYGFQFTVITTAGQSHKCFMKACVAYAAGIPLKDIFAQWMYRRAKVADNDVDTPKLYATGAALLIEEFIPYSVDQALADIKNRHQILRRLGSTAAHLVKMGFAPISMHDWRSRGRDVVLVDFGQDLGPADIAVDSESGVLSELIDNLSRAAVKLSGDELRLIGSAYEKALLK